MLWTITVTRSAPDTNLSMIPALQELDEAEYGHLFVKRAVTRALDKHNHEREMSSILLSSLYGEVGPFRGRCKSMHSRAGHQQQPGAERDLGAGLVRQPT